MYLTLLNVHAELASTAFRTVQSKKLGRDNLKKKMIERMTLERVLLSVTGNIKQSGSSICVNLAQFLHFFLNHKILTYMLKLDCLQ